MNKRDRLRATQAWPRAKAALKRKLGSDANVAKALGISPQAMWKWEAVPPLQVPRVADLTGIPAYRLRPDLPTLFPRPTAN